MLVLELAAEHRAGNGSDDTVATHLVATKVSRRTTTKRAHQASVALSLGIGVCGAVLLLAGLAVCVGTLALRVLVVGIGALLRELVLRLCAGILAWLCVLSIFDC